MSAGCAFDTGFDSGFQICAPVVDEGTPDTRYLRGVPSVIPHKRRRPEVRELSGVGYISVLGVGKLTGEACLAGNLQQETTGFGHLVRETFRVLVGHIRSGAEALLHGERAIAVDGAVSVAGVAILAGEQTASGVGAQHVTAHARLSTDAMIGGRLPIHVGAEGALTPEENDEDLILMAAAYMMMRRRRAKSPRISVSETID